MKRIKGLENKIKELQANIIHLQNCVVEEMTQRLKIYNNLKTRDELIESKFLGKLTDRKVIDAFKSASNYLVVRAEILKYNFTNLDVFLKILKEFERKEEMLNTFRPLANKKTEAK